MPGLLSYARKKVVLTGGSSGVGAALVPLLVEAGCTDLIVLDREPPSTDAVHYIAVDMADPASIDAALDEIGGGVDVLFNNAGVAGTNPTELVIRVNYLGPRRLAEGLLPTMPRGATIVNTASIAGQGWPENLGAILELIALDDWDTSVAWLEEHDELVSVDAYGFSKQIVQVWTMHASQRSWLDHGVRTNSVCPGPIDTPLMVDFKEHMGEPVIKWTVEQTGGTMLSSDDIARVLLLLGTDAAGAVNGHNLIADNGFSAAMATGQIDFSTL